MAVVLLAAVLSVSGFKMSVFTGQSGGLFENYVRWVSSNNLEYGSGYLPTSGSVTIGDYTIKTAMTTADRKCPAGIPSLQCTQGLATECAPSGTTGWNYGCYTRLQIYKNNVLIKDTERCSLLQTAETGTIYLPNGLAIEPLWKTTIGDSGGGYYCQTAINTYSIRVPKDAINVSVASPQAQYFEGQDVAIDVLIQNGWMDGINAQLETTFEIPTMVGAAIKKESKTLALKLGENKVSYTLPTVKNTEKLRVTPSVSITLPKERISGLNTYSNGAYRPNSADFNMGTVTEKTFEIMIIPKPLYLAPPCIAGYTMNTKGDYCVRDDIKSLSCYQLGCPNVEGHEYECTSAGICAETVYKTVWGNCPDGTVATNTSEGEQICIKTEIAETILGCEQTENPPNVCAGITAQCMNKKWEFSGKCNVITEKQTIEVVREVIVEKPVDRIVTVSVIPNWIYYILGAMGLITVFALMKKKRR